MTGHFRVPSTVKGGGLFVFQQSSLPKEGEDYLARLSDITKDAFVSQ
jgi:hypothetical protein